MTVGKAKFALAKFNIAESIYFLLYCHAPVKLQLMAVGIRSTFGRFADSTVDVQKSESLDCQLRLSFDCKIISKMKNFLSLNRTLSL